MTTTSPTSRATLRFLLCRHEILFIILQLLSLSTHGWEAQALTQQLILSLFFIFPRGYSAWVKIMQLAVIALYLATSLRWFWVDDIFVYFEFTKSPDRLLALPLRLLWIQSLNRTLERLASDSKAPVLFLDIFILDWDKAALITWLIS